MLPFMMYNTSYKTKMCLAEFKGFAQLYCLCRRVRIRNFVFPALVTAFSPRALLGFGVFKLRRVLVRKVPTNAIGFPKGDVTRDDSQRRFLAQHNVATLLRHCFEWSQHCSNIATLCCAKNRRCESSRVTSP